MDENLIELLNTYFGDVEVTDDKIIINIKKEDVNKEKINQLSDDTFTSVCEELGNEKVKELSDNNDYKGFVDYAKEWIDNKIDELQEELEMLSKED